MAKRSITDEEIKQIDTMRRGGMTIEETAFALNISTSTVQRYGPKGVVHSTRKDMHLANARSAKRNYLDPGARIVNTTVGRIFR